MKRAVKKKRRKVEVKEGRRKARKEGMKVVKDRRKNWHRKRQ